VTALPRIYLDGTDLERASEAFMRFRLTYNGPLKSGAANPGPMQTDKRAEHKHDIRREFHRQLKHLWTTGWLNRTDMCIVGYESLLPERAPQIIPQDQWKVRRPLADFLGDIYAHSGYRFVPLVRSQIKLGCSLRILFLRRDFPAPVLTAGDIDNRVKTLVDALRMPTLNEGVPVTPDSDENPFFVLLDDDRQVTHLEIEADAALAASEKDPADVSFARIVISVDIRPLDFTMYNLSFS
jgi:hypothetical protein